MTAALKDLTLQAARHWVVNLILLISSLNPAPTFGPQRYPAEAQKQGSAEQVNNITSALTCTPFLVYPFHDKPTVIMKST